MLTPSRGYVFIAALLALMLTGSPRATCGEKRLSPERVVRVRSPWLPCAQTGARPYW